MYKFNKEVQVLKTGLCEAKKTDSEERPMISLSGTWNSFTNLDMLNFWSDMLKKTLKNLKFDIWCEKYKFSFLLRRLNLNLKSAWSAITS